MNKQVYLNKPPYDGRAASVTSKAHFRRPAGMPLSSLLLSLAADLTPSLSSLRDLSKFGRRLEDPIVTNAGVGAPQRAGSSSTWAKARSCMRCDTMSPTALSALLSPHNLMNEARYRIAVDSALLTARLGMPRTFVCRLFGTLSIAAPLLQNDVLGCAKSLPGTSLWHVSGQATCKTPEIAPKVLV